MTIRAIKRNRISDEVFEQIKEHIFSGEWAPGRKIPGELELVELFGVSRVSVREAIHRLVGMGILTIRRGEGTFVNEVLPENYFNALLPVLMIEGAGLLEMLEFRSMIEVESARLASRRADEHDIARMSEIINGMEKFKGDELSFAAADLNFHTAVALATHNSVIIKVNAIVHDMLKKSMEEIINITGYEGGLYYHNKILDAIVRRDEQTAAKLMREHIDVTISKVLEIRGGDDGCGGKMTGFSLEKNGGTAGTGVDNAMVGSAGIGGNASSGTGIGKAEPGNPGIGGSLGENADIGKKTAGNGAVNANKATHAGMRGQKRNTK